MNGKIKPMKKQKGQITIANISGMAIILFIFAVAWKPITNGLSTAFQGANTITQIAIILIPIAILISILTMPLTLAQKERERRQRQTRRMQK